MKKFTILITFLILVFVVHSQDKKLLKIEKFYEKAHYEKCISVAQKYIEDNNDHAGPYFFMSMSYYQEYNKYKDNFSVKTASKYLHKGMQKKNAEIYQKKFKHEIDSLHTILVRYAHNYYEANKSRSKTYFEYLAKIYNDTLDQYYEVVEGREKRPDAEIIDLIRSGELNQTDENGLKQGKWKKVYSNGETAYEVFFKNGKPIGEYKRYHENGELASFLNYDSLGNYASAFFYDTKGNKISEGYYSGQLKDSLWIYYKNDLKIKEETYKDGKLNCEQITYFENGQIVDKKRFEDDTQIGLWERYHKNGNPHLKAFLVDGLMEGPIFRYYYSGALEVKGQYKNDMKEGKWHFYSEDGHEEMIEYKNGVDVNENQVEIINSEEYRKNIEKGKNIADPEQYSNNPEDYPK